MFRPWISILGLMASYPDVLDNLHLPVSIDRQTVLDNICLELAELPLVYADPAQLKTMVGIWSRRRVDIWERLEKTLHFEYNPIHNYDRTEEERILQHETTEDLETRDLAGTSDRTYNSDTSSLQNAAGTSNTTTTNSKTAYDSGALAVSDETVGNQETEEKLDSAGTQKDTDDVATTDTGTVDRNITREYRHGREHRAYGNIGVTTTQQMIQQEREVIQFDIYKYIVDDFKSEFCVMIY